MLVEIDMVLYGTWRRGLEWPQGIQKAGHLPGEATGTAAVAQVASIMLDSEADVGAALGSVKQILRPPSPELA